MEWAGFNARLDRQEAEATPKKPKTLVVFGPHLDAPPAHPDTVLTTLIYLEKTLKPLECSMHICQWTYSCT
ncbi:hypothetical protein ACOMHN_032339 [Nucella lapillus]